jgi:hypothetical protein
LTSTAPPGLRLDPAALFAESVSSVKAAAQSGLTGEEFAAFAWRFDSAKDD